MKVKELKEILEDAEDNYEVILINLACNCYYYQYENELQEVKIENEIKTVKLVPQ